MCRSRYKNLYSFNIMNARRNESSLTQGNGRKYVEIYWETLKLVAHICTIKTIMSMH